MIDNIKGFNWESRSNITISTLNKVAEINIKIQWDQKKGLPICSGATIIKRDKGEIRNK